MFLNTLAPVIHLQAAILYNLKNRHMKGKPYTRTGDIVIACNPFQWFTELYSEKQRALYSNKLVWNDNDKDAREGLEPHVYEVSALSYKGLAFGGADQSILVSGESGAGKTETVKICMNHMASVQNGPSKGGSDELDPVVKRVVESNPLLEAFGNAKTRRNDNSSRFGKYLQLQFDNSEASTMAYGPKTESKCKLAGSTCDVYLLEKNRVVGHESEERTFHVFYQLLAAPDSEKTQFWSGLQGTNNDSFKYVGYTDTTKIEGMSDAEHFHKTVETLALIGVKGKKLDSMMKAICIVLQLGNLAFNPDPSNSDKSKVATKSELKDLAALMGVSNEDLKYAITERTMKTKSETYKVPLNADAAKDACDALAKEIYGNIFLWLVKEINIATRAEDNYKDGTMTKFGIVGLLDIFGFESFVTNRFEQLCINYANEKLQQKFTEDIFRSVQQEYEAEGIDLADIFYDDNTDVLDLIESRTGLLALLNEECVRPKGNDQDFVQKALRQNDKSPCLIINKIDRMSFGIHHYAGKVMYDAEGFVGRNQDTLPTDLSDLVAKSTNTVVASVMASEEEPSSSEVRRGAPKRAKSNLVAPTVWGKYKTQLASLMSNLRKTESRYIRCIKPNMKKVPILLEHIPTVEQLRCAGVVAAVTLSRSAFPNKLNNSIVRYRYGNQWDQRAYPSKKKPSMMATEGIRADCDAILRGALKPKEEEHENGRVMRAFVVGKTRSYFRAGALEYLEANRLESGLDGPATSIQAVVRGFLLRRKWDDLTAGSREKERKKKEEEERTVREKAQRKAEKIANEARQKAAAVKQKADAARQKALKEEKALVAERAAKAQEDLEKREKKAKVDKMKRERAERRVLEIEEEEEKERLKALKNTISKLERDLEEKKAKNEKKIGKLQADFEEAEGAKAELKKKHDTLLKKAGMIDKGEVAANKKKVDESEKIVDYLRKENKKVRDQTEKMKEDLQEMKDQNNRLVEANASAGASLDSLEKQKKNLSTHNSKLADNLKKYNAQNDQLRSDLENRNSYFKAETQIRNEYEKAMEQIVDLLEDKCKDHKLVDEVNAAQLQCEVIASHKSSNISPGLIGSDVSDF
jgi:myosin-5